MRLLGGGAMAEDGRQIDAFRLHDPDTGEECWVGVRAVGGKILLAVSRQSGGDVEVPLRDTEALRLARALSNDVARAGDE